MDSHRSNEKRALYQVSLLQGLTYGDYRGSVRIEELCAHGDVGLGTFDRLNGELILIDGEAYRAAGDGSVTEVARDETTPFAVATRMGSDFTCKLSEVSDIGELERGLQTVVDERGKNRFYMIRIDGLFDRVNVRSVPAQSEPYRPLVEVLEREQTFFERECVKGSIVGLYCPPYMSYLNAVGWHMHFISEDRSFGGHLLGIEIAEATLHLCDVDALKLSLPTCESFHRFDLTLDQSRDIERVEKNK